MDALRLHLFLLVVLMVKAEEEPFLGQRDVTFDLFDGEPLQGQEDITFDEFDGDIAELFNQRAVLSDIPKIHRGKGALKSGPSVFRPRSMGRPDIPFPLARPNPSNVQAICRYSNQRPRYPKELLPTTGFGYLSRQANAVNHLESWFSVCCSSGAGNEELILCCAEQAWTKSLTAFCAEEFSIKTSHYHCCREKESERLACFENAAPDRSYQPSGQGSFADIPSMTENFDFNPTTCQKASSQIAPRALGGKMTGTPNAIFPPGLPNSANIESICANRKQRRRYLHKCLSQKGNSGLALQTKAIIDLDRDFNQCCKKKKNKLTCAESKWKTMVDDFCANKKNADLKQFDCCENEKREEQYDCFAAAAPSPDYIFEKADMSSSQASPTLDMFCDMFLTYHSVARKQDLILDTFAGEMAKKCCSPVEEKNPACLQNVLKNTLAEKCSNSLFSFYKCCKGNSKNHSRCVTKQILNKLSGSDGLKCPVLS